MRFCAKFIYINIQGVKYIILLNITTLAICWLWYSLLHQRSEKSSCSSQIVTKLMGVFISVINTNTLLESLLPVSVKHFNDLLMSPIHQLESGIFNEHNWPCISIRSSVILLTVWWALWQPSPTVLSLSLSIVMHVISLHWWISGRVCYLYMNNNR